MNSISSLTVFISGIFGLIVASLTWVFAYQLEKRKFRKSIELQELKDKEAMYIALLSTINKSIRVVKNNEDSSTLVEELSISSAKTHLFGTTVINARIQKISDLLYSWSIEYKSGMPQKIGGTGFSMVSNMDFEHRDKANALFIELSKEVHDLVIEIKTELQNLKSIIAK